ncbi:hypothetical protein CPB83DRAFT_772043 [Crepidotus variabilis]|uniref:EXPERA domain-containing protein n=1 Tax=Crepidotus variabilis TaxID=179855 RepID=A0A9P6JM53_9AGAR|nr:hypothetical protein CPB83DRAFT_772043 [Crepidotus variabilis]
MAVKTHTWISLWFLLSAPVIIWDVTYCFMRPRSFAGGDLHWIWKPYELYEKLYGPPHYEQGGGFTNAQSAFNVIETALNIYYLYLAHVQAWSPATLVGFSAALMTLSKTVLYWAQEYFCDYCATGQNDPWTLLTLWVIPNGIWIVIPAFIVYRLGEDLIESLNIAAKVSAPAKKKTTPNEKAKGSKL